MRWIVAVIGQRWVLLFRVAEVTLERWLTIAILLYTVAQLYFLVRDKWWRDPQRMRKRKGLCDVE